jgi:hypothetical protein
MEYTLEQALKAKEELIKLGFYKEEHFYLDEDAHECGFLKGEYFLNTFPYDDFLVSAYEHYNGYLYSIDEEAQKAEEEYFLNLYADEL